jgi:hypothetical protein
MVNSINGENSVAAASNKWLSNKQGTIYKKAQPKECVIGMTKNIIRLTQG